MNPIFEQLNSICKKDKLLTREYIEEYYVGGYLIIKWIGFTVDRYSDSNYVLSFLNNLSINIFNDKYEEYLYLYNTIPTIKYVNFNYISKKKIKNNTDITKDEKVIDILCEMWENNREEIKYLIENKYIDIEHFKKILL